MATSTALFTPDQIAADARNAVVRTTGQVGAGAATVNVGEWVAQLAGWHGHIPTTVRDSMVVLLTVGWAAVSNWRKLGGRL